MDDQLIMNKHWKTRSIYLASFVLARGAEFVNVEIAEEVVVYVFADSDEARRLAAEYLTDTEALVDARWHIDALDRLHRRAQEALEAHYAQEG